ncbi:hypothetical protein D3C81_712180 [compost metagenome]
MAASRSSLLARDCTNTVTMAWPRPPGSVITPTSLITSPTVPVLCATGVSLGSMPGRRAVPVRVSRMMSCSTRVLAGFNTSPFHTFSSSSAMARALLVSRGSAFHAVVWLRRSSSLRSLRDSSA